MQAIVSAFWQIMVFRQGPDYLPDSRPLLVIALASYVFVDVLVIAALYPREALVLLLVVDAGFLAAVCAGLLALFGYSARLCRSLTALYGTGALLQLLAFPLSAWPAFGLSVEIPLLFRVLVSVAILLWSVAVYGHIFARAVSKSFGIGIAIAVIYFIVIYEFAAQWAQVN